MVEFFEGGRDHDRGRLNTILGWYDQPIGAGPAEDGVNMEFHPFNGQ